MATGRTMAPRRIAMTLMTALACLPLAAPAAPAVKDPLEKLNRATYAFNDALDRMLARPAAKAYKQVAPEFVQHAVTNFLVNITYTAVVFNDALQGKVRQAGGDAARFVVNTTIGVGGFIDVATHMGLERHEEDFGQTLGYWGVPPGPYLVIPLLGPSDLRDAPAKVVDVYTEPMHYFGKKTLEKYGLYGVELIDTRARLLPADESIRNAYDPYAFVRNAYLARRNYLVHDGNIPDEDLEDPSGDIPTSRVETPAADALSATDPGLPGTAGESVGTGAPADPVTP